MKHYYLLITCGEVLDTSARFYKVGIGSSKSDTRDFLKLTAIAVDRGYFFQLWGNDTTDFLSRCIESVFGSSSLMEISKHLTLVSSRELVRSLEGETMVPVSLSHIDNARHCMRYLDINYRCAQGRRK